MKTIRWIQNVAAVAGMIVALNTTDKLDITFKEACTAGVLIVLVIAMLLGRALEDEKGAE
ncbi:hypothetical protein [Bacteroides sp.]|uniref:hypothetical protein n=1 Tax=Bacteroides sp. TaxID=29523 RepID=UPI002630F2EA|nr:hypothetical protein [Bacteroides sp.]MDD3039639.1 hypothetical protein [Bacteroides sp.]